MVVPPAQSARLLHLCLHIRASDFLLLEILSLKLTVLCCFSLPTITEDEIEDSYAKYNSQDNKATASAEDDAGALVEQESEFYEDQANIPTPYLPLMEGERQFFSLFSLNYLKKPCETNCYC